MMQEIIRTSGHSHVSSLTALLARLDRFQLKADGAAPAEQRRAVGWKKKTKQQKNLQRKNKDDEKVGERKDEESRRGWQEEMKMKSRFWEDRYSSEHFLTHIDPQ